jgi:hypothetical protein
VTLRMDMTWDAADMAKLRRYLALQPAKVGALPHVMADPVDAFVYDYGHSVLNHAKDRSPEDTGKMKKSLRFAWGPWGATVAAKTPGGWVDQGTKPHWPPVKALEGWAKRHGIPAFLVARSIARKGTKRTGWFTDAISDADRELPGLLQRTATRIEAGWR